MTRPISAVSATARTDQDSIDLPASLRYALLPSAPTREPIPAASTTPTAVRESAAVGTRSR
jgi:hypothetical protein